MVFLTKSPSKTARKANGFDLLNYFSSFSPKGRTQELEEGGHTPGFL
jgi:hypothetical protein